MVGAVIALANLLRDRGVPVSTPEIMDSLWALELVPVYDSVTIKTVLQTALVKDRDCRRLFDRAFEEIFAAPPVTAGEAEGEAPFNAIESEERSAGIDAGGSAEGGSGGRGEGQHGSGRGTALLSGVKGKHINEKKGEGDYRPGESNLINLPFIAAGNRQKEEMLSLIRDLSRKMAVKKGAKSKSGGCRLNFRKLWRNSMGAGGVPFALAWQQRSYNKPRVFIICDMSKSMTPFLPFVLQFVFSFAAAHSTVRVFAFVDSLEEITDRIDPVDIKKSVEAVCSGARVVRRGLTDYGNAFKGFFRRHRNELTSRTTIIVVGDARNNSFPSETNLLGEMDEMSAGVYWLNPENSAFWGMGDSYMNVYAPHCRAVIESRNIKQLRDFMEHLL